VETTDYERFAGCRIKDDAAATVAAEIAQRPWHKRPVERKLVWVLAVAVAFLLAFAIATLVLFARNASTVLSDHEDDGDPNKIKAFVKYPPKPATQPAPQVEAPPEAAPAAPSTGPQLLQVGIPPSGSPAAAARPRYMLEKTYMLGTPTTGRAFETLSPRGEHVIGFRIAMSKSRGDTIVKSLDPIYPSDGLVVTQSMIVARPGYAVGGVRLAGDRQINAVRVVFMRLAGDGVDPSDSYQSDWQGDWARWSSFLLGGDGHLVAGTYGRQSTNLSALGLIVRKPAPAAASAAAN
jgi:hypothetical protein